MRPKTIAVDCACGHSHEIPAPENEYALERAVDTWSDALCLNCELNGNPDMGYCETHKVYYKLDGQCWKCDYKR